MAFVLRKPPDLAAKHAAYPYQLDAIHAIKNHTYAAVFHEQGLGKTKIAIDLALLWLQEDVVDTVFVITKKSLVDNWRKEIVSHSHITPRILAGSGIQNSVALNAPVLLYVTNYEFFVSNKATMRLFLQTCRVGCILDESQKIKNPGAGLTQLLHDLSPLFSRRLIMTGTPAANRPYDLWAQIKFLDDGAALGNSFDTFKETVDLPNTGVSAASYGKQLEDIFDRLSSFAVRETKDTAGIELPSKTVVVHPINLPPWQMKKYAAYRNKLTYEYTVEGELQVDDAESILKRLLRLVQCASHPGLIDGCFENLPGKFPLLLEMCHEFTQESKVIIWTNFVENVTWLAEQLVEFDPIILHGSLPMDVRNAMVTSFIEEAGPVLIATPGAAKEGLTLTVANHAIFYDRSFSLDDYLQAQDRIHRISQTRSCYIHNLIANDTIDDWIDILLTAKYYAAQLAQGDIDIKTFQSVFRTDISEVLQAVLSPNSEAP